MSPVANPAEQNTLALPASSENEARVLSFYKAMFARWGQQNWWPASSRFEVIVGAYLTQNTNWRNVETALGNLRWAKALSLTRIRNLPLASLEQLIRPAGFFRQKAASLKAFVQYLDDRYAGSLTRMFAQPTSKLRTELLALKGVGPETAGSILLYAGQHPVFVVDAYARRILERHGAASPTSSYEQLRQLVERSFQGIETLEIRSQAASPRHPASRLSRRKRSATARHFNEFHALIVRTGVDFCRKTPDCVGCPLQRYLLAPPNATVLHLNESNH